MSFCALTVCPIVFAFSFSPPNIISILVNSSMYSPPVACRTCCCGPPAPPPVAGYEPPTAPADELLANELLANELLANEVLASDGGDVEAWEQ